MKKWKWLKIAIAGFLIFALARFGLPLAKSGCWLDWCPFASYSSPSLPLSGSAASEVGLNYSQLSLFLSHKNFKKADRETAEKILQAVNKQKFGMLESKDIKNFPCQDLRTLNNLWLHHSQGKFGFTVQQQLYASIHNELQQQSPRNPYLNSDSFDRFAERVEWKRANRPYLEPKDELPLNPAGKPGHLPRYYLQLKVHRCCREFVAGTLCFLCRSPLSTAPEMMQEFSERTKSCYLKSG
ncbi:GUN4 domain-containing protein [Oscillatoria sp. FACHB-1406]|uniref:GUN4 domain-containing protein n=1 Tax=Oscillatoria sp. FACHB-1406 TaxID=2692846 RepID=UPI001688157B|nr:GUN4 domain-containing protein [Oscillatoria sp. FACHB-1406]MBD2577641.1 GUN4 domain-containing protein [Oscillatoria sp. FACHB-1406]